MKQAMISGQITKVFVVIIRRVTHFISLHLHTLESRTKLPMESRAPDGGRSGRKGELNI